MTYLRKKGTRVGQSMAALAVLVLALARPATAGDISFVDMFRSGFATQTADTSVSNDGFRLDTHLFSVGADDFSAVQLTLPNGSPVNLTATSPTVWSFSSSFATQAAMDVAFPTGTYTYDATGTPSDSASSVYTADRYPSAQPLLIGRGFSRLQGMNPRLPFAFQFNSFDVDPTVNEQWIFFTIFDPVANAVVYSAGFLPIKTRNVLVPANTLLPNRTYHYEIIFSNRVFANSPGAAFSAVHAFELRTGASFATGQ